MNLNEEFKDYLNQIQSELLKNTSSPFYSHLLKDFMNDSDKFMSFYDFVMNSQEIYNFEIYKGLLGPLNSFGFYAEIGEVYKKMIKKILHESDESSKVDRDKVSTPHSTTPHPTTTLKHTLNSTTLNSSLFLVSLLDSHSSKFLRSLFSPSLSISLIFFGDFLFKNDFFYESFKILNVVSQSILMVGYPPKEVMDKYWFIMGYFFLREGSYYSFMNCVNKENMKIFGSKEDFKKILKIIKIKNEGNEFKKLLLKRENFNEIKEVDLNCDDIKEDDDNNDNYDDIQDINNDNPYFTNDTPHFNNDNYINEVTPYFNKNFNTPSLINLNVPFSYWDFYFNFLDKEIDFKDFNFISFLKKNNLEFEIKGNKIKIGKYKFKSISDKIYDIIEKYKEVKDKGFLKGTTPSLSKPTTPTLNKPSSLLTTPSLKPPSLKKSFKDNFSLNKSKFKIYSLILSKIKKNFKMKNEILLKNRKNQFENLKIKEEEKRERLKEYYEIVKDLIKEINENKENERESKDKIPSFNKEISFSYKNKPIKTNWRDLEVNDLQKSIYSGRQFRTKQREDDILSSRTISSFDRTEEEGSKVYKPPILNVKDLKILKKEDEGREFKEGDSSKGKYIPPHLRK